MENEQDTITFFAHTNYRRQMRRFGIRKSDRRHHMYILGKTGMGKTTLMENLIKSDLENGNGLAIFDPHGDLSERVLNHIPTWRKNDVVRFDPLDRKQALSFNLLSTSVSEEAHLVCSGLISLFKKLFREFWGPRLEYILRNSIMTLLFHPGSTLLDISRLLTDIDFRNSRIRCIGDPVLRAFWEQEFGKYQTKFQQEAVSPILNKVGQFATNPIIRNIIGNGRDRVRVERIMENKKILIAQLSKGQIGEDAASLLGAALLVKFQLAALRRVRQPEHERRDFYLYLDEFHEFATESFVSLLPEARKYHLNLICANQYLDQLGEEIRHAVLGNIGTLITLRLGSKDARVMGEEFFPRFSQQDFVNLPRFHLYLKLMIHGSVSEGFSATIKQVNRR
jgi:hypothetical protein